MGLYKVTYRNSDGQENNLYGEEVSNLARQCKRDGTFSIKDRNGYDLQGIILSVTYVHRGETIELTKDEFVNRRRSTCLAVDIKIRSL